MSNPFDSDQSVGSNAYGSPALFDPIAVQSSIRPETDIIGQSSHDIIQETGTSPDSDEPDKGGLSGDRLHKMYLAWEQSKADEMKQAHVSDQYYHGKQWSEKQMAVHRSRKQPTIWHQHIARQVNTMIGTEQRHRRDPKAYPRTPKHTSSSDSVTSALRYVNDDVKFPMQASQAARDFFVRGIGVLYEGVKINAKGEIEHDKHWISSDWYFYDPCSMAHDFCDAKYMGIVRWLDEDEAIELLLKAGNPDASERVARLVGGQSLVGSSEHSQWGGRYSTEVNQKWVDPDRRRIRLVEIWYQHRGTWHLAYLVKDIKLHDQKTPFTHEDGVPRQPYNAISCYIDETGMRYGVVKDMIPVQNEINFLHSKITWALSVRQVMWKRGQVDDIDKFRKELTKADGSLEYKGENAPEILSMMDQVNGLRELEGQAVTHLQNLGPNASLVGQGEGVEKQSGRAIMARQNAGMTEMAPVYERLREWKLSSYRNDWAIIRQFWRSPKWLRVLDDDKGQEFVGFNIPKVDPQTGMPMLDNDVSVLDMDIIIEEGPDVVTMQEEMFNRLAEMGNAVPPEVLIELSALPNKQKVLKMLAEQKAPPPEMVQMQQKMAELEAIVLATEADKNVAATEKSRADAAHTLMETALLPAQHLQNSMPQQGNALPMDGDPGMAKAPPPPNPMQAQAGVAPLSAILQQFPFEYSEPSFADMFGSMNGGGNPQSLPPPGGPQGGARNPPGAASAIGTAGPDQGSVPPIGLGEGPPPQFDLSQLGQMLPPM